MTPNLTEMQQQETPPQAAKSGTHNNKFVFDKDKVTVIFVLGGPGAGKGTQCGLLTETFNCCHLSAGELLREEAERPDSQFGDLIRTALSEGTIVPMEVTIKLLENAMHAALQTKTGEGWGDGKGRFLIDGFPRKMDQALKFEEDVCPSSLVIFFKTDEETLLKRLLKRGETSGRNDDNIESIKKRFTTFKEVTMPVLDHYEAQRKVAEIDSSPPPEEVHTAAIAAVKRVLI